MVVDELLSAMGGGLLNNKFQVTITPPMMLSASNLLNKITGGPTKNPSKDTIRILAKSTSIPSKSISTVDVWNRGKRYPIRGKATFDQRWTVTFYNDSKMGLRGFFEEWIYQMDKYDGILLDTPFTSNYLGTKYLNTGYQTNISLYQLCGSGKRVAEYEMVHAFPVEISAQDLISEQGGISEFTVTFAYDYWNRIYSNGLF